jgi:phospholipid-binding lipoprotein MlaA
MRPRKTVLLPILTAFVLAASVANAEPSATDNAALQTGLQQNDPNAQQPAKSTAPVPMQLSANTASQDYDSASPEQTSGDDTNDPLEGMNRGIFRVNLALDHILFRPLAIGYHFIVPHPIRNSIRNFLNNLDSPPIFANEILQGEFHQAGVTVLRFGVNSTVGVGGLFEVADGWGYPRHTEDFGQTLGKYGVGEGPYLFLPIIGPAPPRDLTGRVVDYFFDPLTYVHMGSQNYWRYVRVSLDAIDLRERNIQTLDDIERTSIDYYATIRSLYRQTRNHEINNNKPNTENLPNF